MTFEQLLSFAMKSKPVIAVLMGLFGWQLLTGVVSVLTKRKTAEKWEAWAMTKPGLAFVVECLRASGLDPQKLLNSVDRYAKRRAGILPDAAVIAACPPAIRAALEDPAKRAALEAWAQRLAAVDNAPSPEASLPISPSGGGGDVSGSVKETP